MFEVGRMCFLLSEGGCTEGDFRVLYIRYEEQHVDILSTCKGRFEVATEYLNQAGMDLLFILAIMIYCCLQLQITILHGVFLPNELFTYRWLYL